MSYRSTFTALVFALLFNACTKNQSASPGSSRLKLVGSAPDSIGFTRFIYDSKGRVAALVDSQKNGYFQKTVIEYNAQGNPLKFIRTDSWNNSRVESLIYNNEQKIVRKITAPFSNGSGKILHSYTYDLKGRLLVDSSYSPWSSNVVDSYIKFLYDDRDNIIEERDFYLGNSTTTPFSVRTFTYDNQASPFVDISELLYFHNGLYWYFLFGKNNMLTTSYQFPQNTFPNSAQTFDYEYEHNNVKRIIIHEKLTNGEFIKPIDFLYE